MAGTLISVAEVLPILLGTISWERVDTVSIGDATNRILAEAVGTDKPVPPFDRVMMDGYAVRSEDWNRGVRQFVIHGAIDAGDCRSPVLPPGGCLAIATGSPLPAVVDAVVPVEYCSIQGNSVTIDEAATVVPGGNVHPCGSDAAAGSILLQPGTRLRSVELGTAAACGFPRLTVAARPACALLSTGSELVAPGAEPGPGQVRLSNPFAIEAVLRPLTSAWHHRHVPDTLDSTRDALQSLLKEADIVVTVGGLSKGRKDWIAPAIESLGGRELFRGVAQKPGKPMAAWAVGPTHLVVALPGNPVSALIGAHRYIAPFLLALQGATPGKNPHLRLAADYRFPKPLTRFLPVRVDPSGTATPSPENSSGDFVSLLRSDGFLEIPADCTLARAGDSFPFFPWLPQ